MDDAIRVFIDGIRQKMGDDLEAQKEKSTVWVTRLLQKIDELCFANKLRFVFIADQFNTVQNKVTADVKPFSEFSTLHSHFPNRSGMIILSGSANNEFPLKLTDFQKVDFNDVVTDLGNDLGVTLGFTEAEFEVWVDHFKGILGDGDWSDLKYVTNLIPWELSLFLQAKRDSPTGTPFPDVMQKYRNDRIDTLRQGHTKYFVGLDVGIRGQFIEAARHLYLKMTGGKTDVYDRQLMYFHANQFRAITPLAALVLFEKNNSHFGNLEKSFLEVLGVGITADAVGRLFEAFLQHSWGQSRELSFTSRVVGDAEDKRTNFSGLKLEFFESSGIPTTLPRDPGTLFIPRVPNYPIVDYIYFSYTREVYFFQLTVQLPITGHMSKVPWGDPADYGTRGVMAWYHKEKRNIAEAWMDHLVWKQKKAETTIRSLADCHTHKIRVTFIGYPANNYDDNLNGLEVADIEKFSSLQALAAAYKEKQKEQA